MAAADEFYKPRLRENVDSFDGIKDSTGDAVRAKMGVAYWQEGDVYDGKHISFDQPGEVSEDV